MALRPRLWLLLLLLFVSMQVQLGRAEPTADRAALLDFLARTPHENRIRWDANQSACDWVGVRCDANRTAVVELRLPGAGLAGQISPGTIGRLSSLRVLSFRSNRLSGELPDDLSNLTLLRALYVQDNLFSGPFPPPIPRLNRLLRLDLSSNNFSGEIPFAVNNLTRLTRLFIEQNRLSGSLPSISIANLSEFNVSYNDLNGSIPETLARFPASSFVGNMDLCGGPLPACKPFFPAPAPSPEGSAPAGGGGSSSKLSTAAIVAISVAGGALAIMLLILLLICWVFRRRRRRRSKAAKEGGGAAAGAAVGRSGESTYTSKDERGIGGDGDRTGLVFVGKGAGYRFDLEDLLRASAEVLGKGSVGTSYKAVLEEGTTVVVKRLKDVTASRREFESHIELLGKVEHENLLPLRAYYYSKDEKLLVLDYLPAGSLSSLLHGSRGSGRTPLDWESRLRVAIAAGRGLAHLHGGAGLVHGNIKASNVLLRDGDPDAAALSDFALHPLFPPSAARSSSAGYRAPEVAATLRFSPKSDVYALGVLILELLTGKSPTHAAAASSLGGEDALDLPRWVQSVVREEWTAEVFDAELMRYPDGAEEEMVGLLQVAMACVAPAPDARPDAAEVLKMMEELAGRGSEGGLEDTRARTSSAGPLSPARPSSAAAAAATP